MKHSTSSKDITMIIFFGEEEAVDEEDDDDDIQMIKNQYILVKNSKH